MAFTSFSQHLKLNHTTSTDTLKQLILTTSWPLLAISIICPLQHSHNLYMKCLGSLQALSCLYANLKASTGAATTSKTSILASTFYKHCHHSKHYSHSTSTSTSSQLLHTDSSTFYSNDSYWHYHSLFLHFKRFNWHFHCLPVDCRSLSWLNWHFQSPNIIRMRSTTFSKPLQELSWSLQALHNHFSTLIVSSILLQPVIAISWTFKNSTCLYKPSQGLDSILSAFISYLTVSTNTVLSL